MKDILADILKRIEALEVWRRSVEQRGNDERT